MHVFGEVVNGEMVLNDTGKIARDEWFKTAELRPYVKLYDEEFVIMPNHGHGIIWIEDEVGTRQRRVQDWAEQRAGQRRAPTDTIEEFGKPVKGSIPTIVRAYKSAVTYAVNAAENQRGAVLWQKNYYEHIIRNDRELKIFDGILSTIRSGGNWIVTIPETAENYLHLNMWMNM